MDKFLTPTSRPSSAMSQRSDRPSSAMSQRSDDGDDRDYQPEEDHEDDTVIDIDEAEDSGSNKDNTKQKQETPYVYEFIKAFWGPSKREMSFKCRVKYCNSDIKYSSTSFYNLKKHYEKQHPQQHSDFVAALSAGYAYKKRGRNTSGARYEQNVH